MLASIVPTSNSERPTHPTTMRQWERPLRGQGDDNTRMGIGSTAIVPTDPTVPPGWKQVGKGNEFECHGQDSKIVLRTTYTRRAFSPLIRRLTL